MRIRTSVFWSWVDPTLEHRAHEESLDNGTTIDVQVQSSRTGNTQVFIGVYASGGMVLYEEVYDSRRGDSMTGAISWGVERAKHVAVEGKPRSKPRTYKL